jgi:chromosome segregation ATPase
MASSRFPQTLDNLCSSDKTKVVEMLKKLNQLRKRCTLLEQEFEIRQREKEKEASQQEVLAHQLEVVQGKLLETVELSGKSQEEIESLSLKLQRVESERKSLSLRFHDSQLEAQSLRENIEEIELQHNHVLVTIATQTSHIYCDKSCNTLESAVNLQNAIVQVSPDALRRHSQVLPSPDRFYSKTLSPITPLKEPDSDLDDELTFIISFLNP